MIFFKFFKINKLTLKKNLHKACKKMNSTFDKLIIFDFDLTLSVERVFGDQDFNRPEFLFGHQKRLQMLQTFFETLKKNDKTIIKLMIIS